MDTLVPVVAKMLLGIETTPAIIFSSTSFWRMRSSMPLAAVMKPVVAGRQVGNQTVIEQGLDAGERVVTDGQGKLAPGSKVSIKAAGGAATAAPAKQGGTP